MNFFKITLRDIYIGVIVSVLLIYLIEPLFKFVGSNLMLLVQFLSKSLYDQIFVSIAFGQTDYGYMIFTIATFLLCFAILNLTKVNNSTSAEDIEALAKEFENSAKEKVIVDHIVKLSDEKKEEFSKEIKALISQGEEEIKGDVKKIKIIAIIVAAITCIVIGGYSIIGAIKLDTTREFEQQVKILTPYIEIHSKELLISDFSRMQGYDDFKKLDNKIHLIADSLNIKLPENQFTF